MVVGQSYGTVSIALANGFPDLILVVQDLPKAIEDAKTKAPASLSQLIFQAHDFFEVQPIKDADFYYFRWIFHDWSDKHCVKIRRTLIPALRVGACILQSERCLEPACTLPLRAERWNRYVLFSTAIVISSCLCGCHQHE
jgi:hypothetical protein